MASSRGIGNTLVHKTRLGLCIKYLVSAPHPCVIGAINVISSNNNINLGQPQQKNHNSQPTTSTNLNKKNLQHPTIAKLQGLKIEWENIFKELNNLRQVEIQLLNCSRVIIKERPIDKGSGILKEGWTVSIGLQWSPSIVVTFARVLQRNALIKCHLEHLGHLEHKLFDNDRCW